MNAAENTGAYLSLQQKKDLCNFLEDIPGDRGTEELRKVFFPQRRMYQLLFKFETLTGKELSIEQWRRLCQRLDVEQQFSDRLQGFELRRNPRRGFINSQSRRAYEDGESSQLESLVTQQQELKDLEISNLHAQVAEHKINTVPVNIGRLQTELSMETDESRLREREISQLRSILTQVQADKEQLTRQREEYESLLRVQSQVIQDLEIRNNILQEILKIRNAVLF